MELTGKCKRCGGSGYTIEVSILPRCCARVNEDGTCCGSPEPEQVPEQVQCEECLTNLKDE